jgi:hypothetical protein
MTDLSTILGDAAAVVDPKGENEEISVPCGSVACAVDRPDEYRDGTLKPCRQRSGGNATDAEDADEMARRLVVGGRDGDYDTRK